MVHIQDLKTEFTITDLVPSGAVTGSGNGTGLDLRDYIGDVSFWAVIGAATAGTNPTMDVSIEDSADDISYAAVATGKGGPIFFPQATTAPLDTKLLIPLRNLRRYVRASKTIGGTAGPSFPVWIRTIGQKRP